MGLHGKTCHWQRSTAYGLAVGLRGRDPVRGVDRIAHFRARHSVAGLGTRGDCRGCRYVDNIVVILLKRKFQLTLI